MVSLFFDQKGKTIKYKDNVNRWSGPGNNEFRTALDRAKSIGQTIRVEIVRSSDHAAIKNGASGDTTKNTFYAKEDWFGELVAWDGTNYEIHIENRNQ